MKLISLREFVLNQISRIENCEIPHLASHHQIVDYANFLSRPLELGMFLPCDLEGNVLVKSFLYDPRSKTGNTEYYEFEAAEKAYNEAKSRVLFEGFSMGNVKPFHVRGHGMAYLPEDLKYMTIERLIGAPLTETARKEIGL